MGNSYKSLLPHRFQQDRSSCTYSIDRGQRREGPWIISRPSSKYINWMRIWIIYESIIYNNSWHIMIHFEASKKHNYIAILKAINSLRHLSVIICFWESESDLLDTFCMKLIINTNEASFHANDIGHCSYNNILLFPIFPWGNPHHHTIIHFNLLWHSGQINFKHIIWKDAEPKISADEY